MSWSLEEKKFRFCDNISEKLVSVILDSPNKVSLKGYSQEEWTIDESDEP
jgi:hypothetical protein